MILEGYIYPAIATALVGVLQIFNSTQQTLLFGRAGKCRADAADVQDSFLQTRKQLELHRTAPHLEAPVTTSVHVSLHPRESGLNSCCIQTT